MTREEFSDIITILVNDYINQPARFDPNGQLRVNPLSRSATLISGAEMLNEIADIQETDESAAGMHDAREEDDGDYQASQNPEFYSLSSLVKFHDVGRFVPDAEAIAAIVGHYFPG